MLDWAFYRHSGIHACPLFRSMLYDQSHAACPCPCCMSMSILQFHDHVACLYQCCMPMSMSMYIYIQMPECWRVRHSVTPVLDWKKLTKPGQDRSCTRLSWHSPAFFKVQYRTKIRDAGMPMLVLVFSLPMPSYGKNSVGLQFEFKGGGGAARGWSCSNATFCLNCTEGRKVIFFIPENIKIYIERLFFWRSF